MRIPRTTPETRRRILASNIPTEEKANLRRGSLYWVSDDISLLAHQTSLNMPEWSPIMCKPSASGLIVLAEPLPRVAATHNQPELILTWVTNIDASMTIRVFGNITGNYMPLSRIDLPADVTLPMDTTPTQGATLLEKLTDSFDQHHPSYEPNHAVLQVLGAAWVLMQQETIAKPRKERVFPPSRGGKKPKKPDVVQIINLRRIVPPPTPETTSGDGGREYHVRWLVKGHWRQQRVGPGRQFRRPTYIAPHVKGPEGAPLKTDRVHVWRR